MTDGNAIKEMQMLSCECLTLPQGGFFDGKYADQECILHVLGGKGALIIGPKEGQQWNYPLDSADTVWIPPETDFELKNAGIGNLEVASYLYGA